MNVVRFPLLVVASLVLWGCEKPASETSESKPGSAEESEELTPEERALVKAARPFLDAIVAEDYAAAQALLSSQAQARMSLNQFVPPEDEKAAAAAEAKAVTNPTVADFQKFMALVETAYGKPSKVLSSDLMSTEPQVLSGKGDAMETAFAIGLMPDSIPANIRKAAVRSQIGVTLSQEKLKAVAEEEGMSVEDLQKNEDFAPYCNLKVVLVDEGGQLKVGYFEFTPPSMWD